MWVALPDKAKVFFTFLLYQHTVAVVVQESSLCNVYVVNTRTSIHAVVVRLLSLFSFPIFVRVIAKLRVSSKGMGSFICVNLYFSFHLLCKKKKRKSLWNSLSSWIWWTFRVRRLFFLLLGLTTTTNMKMFSSKYAGGFLGVEEKYFFFSELSIFKLLHQQLIKEEKSKNSLFCSSSWFYLNLMLPFIFSLVKASFWEKKLSKFSEQRAMLDSGRLKSLQFSNIFEISPTNPAKRS